MRVAQKIGTETQQIVSTTAGPVIDMRQKTILHLHANCDVNTPSAKEFDDSDVDVDEDTATIAGHGLTTGLKGQMTTTDTLPTGLATSTDYFAIVVDDDTIKFASSLANALAGTAIDLEDDGTGTHTFTPTSIAGGAVKLQRSSNYDPTKASHLENSNAATWFDIGSSSQNVTTDVDLEWKYEGAEMAAAFVRPVATATAGRFAVSYSYTAKGESV